MSTRPSSSGWLREPLLHFIALGGLLFIADHILFGIGDDPRTIVVGADVDTQAKQVFNANRGRDPNPQELEALRRVWLDNEVLYREGVAMEMDRGDDAIRERVIFKALSVVDANVKLPKIEDKTLREWFEKHRAKYDEPARYTFQEAVLSGKSSEDDVRAFVAKLNSGGSGDLDAGLRVFKDRPYENLVQSYGADFPKELEQSPRNVWIALNTRDGWRAMHIDAVTPAKPAVYEVQAPVVLQDWKDEVAQQQRSAAVRELAKKYKVKYAIPAAANGPVQVAAK